MATTTTITTTELQAQDLEFPVNFKPAEISIGNFDEMKVMLSDYAKEYSNPVITKENHNNDRKFLQQVRGLKKQLNDRRIAIKKEINKPMNDFEKNVKELTGILDTVIDPLAAGIKVFDDLDKEKMRQHVDQLVTDIADQHDVRISQIEFDKKWLNKTVNDKQITDAVIAQIKAIIDSQKRLDEEKAIVNNYASAVKMEPFGWLEMIDNGKSAAEVIKLMDAARERIKAQEALEADKRKKREEYEAAMAKLETEKPTVEVNNKQLDPETGEILSDKLEPEQAEIETINLMLELTDVTSEQTYLLRDFLKDNNFHFALSEGGN